MNRILFLLTVLAITLASGGTPAMADSENDITFLETFALAKDRAAVLQDLIPGTEDYYFFHSLHAQNTGDATAGSNASAGPPASNPSNTAKPSSTTKPTPRRPSPTSAITSPRTSARRSTTWKKKAKR